MTSSAKSGLTENDGKGRHSPASVAFAPYAPGDAAQIERSREGVPPARIEALAGQSWAWTARQAGRVIAVGGVYRLEWRGIGWSALAADIEARALVAVRARMIEALAEAHAAGVDTIETEVPAPFAGGHAWVRSLGFRFAGVLPGPRGGAYALRYAHTADDAQWPGLRVRALLDLTDRTLADRERSAA